MASSYKGARPGGTKANTSTLVTQFQTLNVMDIPQYDNGNGFTSLSTKKGLKSFSNAPHGPPPSRQPFTNTGRSHIVTKTVQPHVAKVQTPAARHKSHKVSYEYADEDLIPKSLKPRKNQAKLTDRAQALGYSPAPGAHKYMTRPLPPLPSSLPSRASVLASQKDYHSTKPTMKSQPIPSNRHSARPRYHAGIDIVDYHLNEGKVTKFNPNQHNTRIDQAERAVAAAALSTYDKDVSQMRLERARKMIRHYGCGRVGLHKKGAWVDCREWRALNRKERMVIEQEINAGYFDDCGNAFSSSPAAVAGSSVGSARRKESRCVIM